MRPAGRCAPLLAAALVAAACGSGGGGAQTQASSAVTPGPDGTLRVRESEFAFAPAVVQLAVGTTVTLVVDNAGAVFHDLSTTTMPVSGLRYLHSDNPPEQQRDNVARGFLDVDNQSATVATVTFTPTRAGTYRFVCDVPGHEAAGMSGTFLVR